jgi:hypothetical protein
MIASHDSVHPVESGYFDTESFAANCAGSIRHASSSASVSSSPGIRALANEASDSDSGEQNQKHKKRNELTMVKGIVGLDYNHGWVLWLIVRVWTNHG